MKTTHSNYSGERGGERPQTRRVTKMLKGTVSRGTSHGLKRDSFKRVIIRFYQKGEPKRDSLSRDVIGFYQKWEQKR